MLPSRRLRRFYHYKAKSLVDLLRRGEFGYLLGVLTEKAIGRNVYLRYLDRRGHSLLVDRDVLGHTLTLDLTDKGLSRGLIIRGVHEPNATPAFQAVLRSVVDRRTDDDLVFLDVGANIGYFALLEAEAVASEGRVYAFEPEPANRRLLEQNVDRSEYRDRIEILPYALGDRDGKATLALAERSNRHRIVTGSEVTSTETQEVEMRTVDSFLADRNIEPSSVVGIRMDLEGYEAAVFDGMDRLLDVDSPMVLFVELHPEELGARELDRILARLEGFRVRFVGQDRRTFDVESVEDVAEIGGSHVHLVLERGTSNA